MRNGLPEWVVPFSVINVDELKLIAQALDLGPRKVLADVACGSGGVGLWLVSQTGASLIGVDFSSTAIANAQELAQTRGLSRRSRFIVADILNTTLPDAVADAVVSIDSLMFCDAQRAMCEIARLLKPGGRVAVVAAEATRDDAPEVLSRNYPALFANAGLEVLTFEVLEDYRERSLRLYHGLNDRARPLRDQMGVGAEYLLAEAASGIERENEPPRVRDVLIIAKLI
ncbi:MAG: class I SAM-dependent methyltransferase [Candidatus Eremiobacteraeota bacterium]|nr:class I SAM-dependent methyltransferase [Candidatus Eremiobacteraeota bacterium]